MNAELEQLLRDLRDEGHLDSAGGFTLDAGKAREKLALRQMREAGLWLVKLIQAAHLWEANRLQFRQHRDRAVARMQLGARSLDLRPWLSRLHQVELMADPDYGPIAMAFQAALADGCTQVELLPTGLTLNSEGVHGPWQSLEPLDHFELVFHYARQEPWWNRLLHLRPPRRSLENFLAARRKAGLALPLVDLDRIGLGSQPGPMQKVSGLEPNPVRMERVWLSSAPALELMLYPAADRRKALLEEVAGRIVLTHPQAFQGLRQWRHEQSEKLALPRGAELAPWLEGLQASGLHTPPPRSQGQALPVRGAICWNLDCPTPAALFPVKYGIALDAIPFTALPAGVSIWLSSSRWRTDLNQKKVVQDELSRQLGDWCLDQFEQMVFEAGEALADSPGALRLALKNQRRLQPGRGEAFPG